MVDIYRTLVEDERELTAHLTDGGDIDEMTVQKQAQGFTVQHTQAIDEAWKKYIDLFNSDASLEDQDTQFEQFLQARENYHQQSILALQAAIEQTAQGCMNELELEEEPDYPGCETDEALDLYKESF